MYANEHVRRFFRRISLLWAFAQASNATITIWLLLTQSLATFVLAHVRGVVVGHDHDDHRVDAVVPSQHGPQRDPGSHAFVAAAGRTVNPCRCRR